MTCLDGLRFRNILIAQFAIVFGRALFENSVKVRSYSDQSCVLSIYTFSLENLDNFALSEVDYLKLERVCSC